MVVGEEFGFFDVAAEDPLGTVTRDTHEVALGTSLRMTLVMKPDWKL